MASHVQSMSKGSLSKGRHMRKTRVAVLGTIAAVAGTLAITASGSANHLDPINIRVDPDRPFVHGVIQSQAERCEAGRYLYVNKIRPGLNKFAGDDITSLRGGWSVDINRPGRYSIRINRDHDRNCGGDRVVVISPGQ
jgi:hypothetical protein